MTGARPRTSRPLGARPCLPGGHAAVIMIPAGAGPGGLITESPAAGFLARSGLSAREIDRILGRTP